MNRHFDRSLSSVFALCIRASFGKILAVLALSGLVQTVLFWIAMDPSNLSASFQNAYVDLVFRLTFLLTLFLLIRWQTASTSGYTLRRLAVSEWTFTLLNALYNALVLLIFWAVQTGIALVLCKLFLMNTADHLVNPQTVFLAFYRDNYLHSLLPLAEISRWARNIAYTLSIGICAAAGPCMMRRGQGIILSLCPAVLYFLVCVRPVGEIGFDIFQSLVVLATAASALFICRKGEPHETSEN